MIDTIAGRYRRLREEIDAQAAACGRDPSSVSLLGVSKKQPVEAILEAAAAGLRAIGENYVQEAAAKFAQLPAIEKHYIGHVQTNKAKKIVELFDVVQTVDRADAATALAAAAEKTGKRLRVLIQVNVSPTDRFGVAPERAGELAGIVRACGALALDGVMAIGPAGAGTEALREAFLLAAKTFALVGGSTLSIGMSGDWREAVAAGSTMVRIGTALFGARG